MAPPWFILAVAVATLLTPGYSHIHQTVSELAAPGTPHPEVLQIGFAVYGVLVLGPTLALHQALRGRPGAPLLCALMLAYSVTSISGAIFRDDLNRPVARLLTVGQMHDYMAMATYGAILGAMLLVPWLVRDRPAWRRFVWFSLALAVLTGLFGFIFNAGSFGLQGVFQRGFFVTTLVWVEGLSLHLLLVPEEKLSKVS